MDSLRSPLTPDVRPAYVIMRIPRRLLALAQTGNLDAQCRVADTLLGVRRSDRHALARPWLLRAAKAGSAWAQYQLGLSYDRGLGVKRSLAKAMYWYGLSSSRGNDSAHLNLGILLANLPGSRRDLPRAIRLYRLAARAGRPNAAYNLGLYYLKGRGVRQSYRWALHWFQRAHVLGSRAAAGQIRQIQRRV